MGDRVLVTNDSGETGYLTPEEAEDYAAQGVVRGVTQDERAAFAKQAELDRYGSGEGAVFATGAGLARGLTGGFSDAAFVGAARALGGQKEAEWLKYDLEMARQANPGISTVADVGGMAAGTLLTGGVGGALSAPVRGAGAIGNAATGGARALLGTSKLANVGARAIGMGAEMSAFGAERALSEDLTRQFVSEDALGTHEINAEHIASAAAKDFLMGAAFGGVVGVASTMAAPGHVSRLFRRGPQVAESRVASMADDVGGGVASADAKAAGGGFGGSKVVVEHVPGEGLTERAGKIRQVFEQATAGTPLEKLAQGEKMSIGKIADWLDDMSAEAVFKGAGRRVKSIEKLDQSFEGGSIAAGKLIRKELPRVLGKKSYAEIVGPAEVQEGAQKLAREFGEKMNVLEGQFVGLDKHLPKTTANDVFSKLSERIEEKFGKIGQESEYNAAQRTVDALKRQALGLERGAELTPEVADTLSTKAISLSEIRSMVKNISSSTDQVAMKATDDIRASLNHMIDDKLQMISKTQPKLSNVYSDWKAAKQGWLAADVLEKLATKGKAQQVQNVFGGIPGMFAGGVGAIAGGVIGGPAGAAVGGQIGSVGAAYLRRRAPYIATEYLQKGKIMQIADSLSKLDKETVAQAKSLLDPLKPGSHKVTVESFGGGFGGASAKASTSSVDRAIDALQNGKVQQRVAERVAPLAEHAPKTAAAVSQTLGRMAAYMLSTAPQPRQYDPIFPSSPGAKYSPEEVDAWNKKWEILGDWTTVTRAAQAGTVTPDMVDTLKVLYPEKYKATQAAFMALLFGDQAQKKFKEMPIERRLSIATLWDIPTTVTDPAFLTAVKNSQQEEHGAQTSPGPDQAPQRQRTSGDAKAASNVAEAMRTDSEDLAHGVGSD